MNKLKNKPSPVSRLYIVCSRLYSQGRGLTQGGKLVTLKAVNGINMSKVEQIERYRI